MKAPFIAFVAPRTTRWLAAASLTALATGCAGDTPPDEVRETGLALTFDTLADTDVAGFMFTATEVDCATGVPVDPANVTTATEDLEDMYIPGTGGMFEDAPFDGASNHLFSDHFFALSPGCYDVDVQPITEDGVDSDDCAPAGQDGVEVIDGETTEILLISQCVGDPSVGGLDVIAALNHPPAITGLNYDPSKFICSETTTICVTAEDPDADPVTIVPAGDGDWTLVSQEDRTGDGVTTSCFTLSFPGPGDYTVDFVAYDMGHDADGVLVPMEDLLPTYGSDATSHDALSVPVHVLPEDQCIQACACPDGFDLAPAGDECVRVDTVPAEATGDTATVCEGDENGAYSVNGAQLPDGARMSDYPALGAFVDRLNEIGVWTCAPDDPIDEWIGFSICLELEEPGAYVIGLGGDDHVRAGLNGVTFFQEDSYPAYNYWWLRPVTLGSGPNVITLEGYNTGSYASVGAELYGPFDPALLTNDADMAALDYDANVQFTTRDIVGDAFTTGVASGMTCPDGYTMNVCGGEITCTVIERVACQ